MGCCGNKFPVASLVGAVLQCIGLALFCSSIALGFNESLSLFENDDQLRANATDIIYYVNISVYSLTSLMIVLAVVFLFEAFLVTAQNSEQFYDDGHICCASPCCVTASIVITAFLLFLWVVITSACALLFTFAMMTFNHYESLGITADQDVTINFRYYGFKYVDEPVTVNNFGTLSEHLVLYFSMAVSGAALVVFGLAYSIACMTSNWVHLRDGQRWKKYAHRRQREERELHEMTSYKSSERLAQSLYY